jgi:hypothetical protein
MGNVHSQRLIKHGIAGIVVAMVAGFGLIFAMIGAISLSPLPIFIPWQIPGSPQGWRMVHVGMMMNGLTGVLLGLAMRQFALTDRGAATVAWGTIIAIWGNFCFYLFGMFAPNHGVTLQGNRLGEANLAGALAFLPGLAAVITLFVALVVLLRAKPQSEPAAR